MKTAKPVNKLQLPVRSKDVFSNDEAISEASTVAGQSAPANINTNVSAHASNKASYDDSCGQINYSTPTQQTAACEMTQNIATEACTGATQKTSSFVQPTSSNAQGNVTSVFQLPQTNQTVSIMNPADQWPTSSKLIGGSIHNGLKWSDSS